MTPKDQAVQKLKSIVRKISKLNPENERKLNFAALDQELGDVVEAIVREAVHRIHTSPKPVIKTSNRI